jgi:hypothetical protein
MITSHIDVGQLIIATLIGVVGFLIARMISRIDSRLDRHEETIFKIANQVQFLIGKTDGKRSS